MTVDVPPATRPLPPTHVRVDGRLVVLSHGTKSQTVNVCTSLNEVGTYEVKYQLRPDPRVEAEDLAELPDLDALRVWLLTQDAFPVPVGRGPGASLPERVSTASVEDDWLADARAAVDRAISTIVEQFLADPYLHRREESLHAALYLLLKDQPALADEVRLSTGEGTQLIHKEWPETIPRKVDGAQRQRGSFDIAILAPSQLKETRLDQFVAGRVDAPIVIEVGLDYGHWHISQDYEKLENSAVKAPYLLHLSRIPVNDSSETESLVLSASESFGVAYVQRDPLTKTQRVKRLAEKIVSVSPWPN